MRPCVYMFAKAPVIGGAKSRLAHGVGKVSAWRHYRAMTAQLVRKLGDRRWDCVLVVTPDRALVRSFPGVWPDHLARLAQGRGDLGLRQARVFARKGPICVIGTDTPQLTRADIAAAFKALKRHDCVIGPAWDGGYWLLALNGPAQAACFQGVRWSHAHTREDLQRQLRRAGRLRIASLRPLRDIDDMADLAALKDRG